MAEALPISGSIDPKAFPFLLMDLHHHGATGSLKVAGPTYQKALYFRGGRILFGSSNDPRDQLGAILIEDGKITPEQLEDVNAKVGPGNPLAKVLAETGFVNQRELSDAARAKVERILSDVLAYATGSFDFEDGVLPKGAVDLKLSTERLTMAAVRRVGDRAFVLRHLEGLDVLLAPTPALPSKLPEVTSEAAGLPEHFDGKRNLKDVAARARLDEFEAAKIACGLLFLGLVSKKPAGAPELDLGAMAADAFSSAAPARRPVEKAAAPAPVAAPPPPPKVEEDAPFVIPESEPSPSLALSTASPDVTIVEAPKPSEPEPEPEPFLIADSAPSPTIALDEPPRIALDPPKPTPPPAPAPASDGPSIGISAPTPPPWKVSGDRAALDSVLKRPTPKIDLSPPSIAPPAPPPRPASRPSKEDLAALDELLNARNSDVPQPTTLAKGTGAREWSPQFSRSSRRHSSGRGVTVALSAVLLLGVAAGGYWYWQQRATASTEVTTPPEPAPTTMAAASTTLPPAEITPATTPALPRPTGAAPAVVTPTTTLAAAPVAPVTSRPAGGSATDPRALLRQGNFPEASRLFFDNVRNAPQGSATIQLLVACSGETIQKALANVPDEDLFIVPFNLNGRACYRVLWGLYPSSSRASGALGSLPGYFRDAGAKPRVVAAAEIGP
jgi:hypothetical protein